MRIFTDKAYIEELKQIDMPNFDAFYAFLKSHYKHDRFEGRNHTANWSYEGDYSMVVANSHYQDLLEYGFDGISIFESNTGKGVYFNRKLEVINN